MGNRGYQLNLSIATDTADCKAVVNINVHACSAASRQQQKHSSDAVTCPIIP